ncbi:substrate-binding domain-containing protein [Acetobacterium sp.]|jgi:tungstate transport system substrate-binding protein|uniref:substrate-binding domain-containing protein n=1 Tax=Acetobacterium sp. TaxID=1872094 RepID=UPI002718D691|nr:substrate-binding domain-containing protein [Acetobacterium sp.]MDO9493398.1 extracellular solute-binding protein [Acetobacterium sp.]
MKKNLSVLVIALFVCTIALSALGCTPAKKDLEPGSNGEIILATTTSTQDSGLLEVILPDFEAQTGIAVKVVAVGTGKAMEMGKAGEADVLLVHARSQEDQFITDGYGVERFDVMYNDFVVLGPKEDPANVKTTAAADATKAFTAIAAVPSTFVSRDDKSGTNTKELAIWKDANITPTGDWYLKTGTGMGETLTVANEKLGYTLADRATYANMKDTMSNLEIVCEGDEMLSNPYGVIAVSPTINSQINAEGAQAFVDWILSPEAQKLIGSYKINGDPLFTPNATQK